MQNSRYFVVDVLAAENGKYLEIFEQYREEMFNNDQGERLLSNYSKENFDLSQQISVFVAFSANTHEIFGFCSIFRPAHWPEGVVRLGNRIWIDRDQRKLVSDSAIGDPFESIRHIIQLMAKVHLVAIKKHGIKLGIFTREVRGHTRNPFSHLLNFEEIMQYGFAEDAYAYYQTVPGGEIQSCWQRILFAETVPGARVLLNSIPRITPDTYANRYLGLPTLAVG